MPAENQTVNPSFNITTTNTGSDKPILLIHAGRQGMSLAQLDTEQNIFFNVQVYHFTKSIHDAALAATMDDILNAENFQQQHFQKILVTWCFEETIVVPNDYFEANQVKAMLDLVYGNVTQVIPQHEIVLAHELHTVYRIPMAIKQVFAARFPFCIQHHLHSLLINFEKVQRNLLYCIFYPGAFTAMLRKNGQLQMIQHFEFAVPEDAAYHLLNMCSNFEVAAPVVMLSGMIDHNSNLYNELHKYFLQLQFAGLPSNFNYADEINELPAHYFSHLFTTALCVL